MCNEISMRKPLLTISKNEEVAPTDLLVSSGGKTLKQSLGGKTDRLTLIYKGEKNDSSEHVRILKTFKDMIEFQNWKTKNGIQTSEIPLELFDKKVALIDINSLDTRLGITASKINETAKNKSVDNSIALKELLITNFLKKICLQNVTNPDGSKPYENITMHKVPKDDISVNARIPGFSDSTSGFLYNLPKVVSKLTTMNQDNSLTLPKTTQPYSLKTSGCTFIHNDDDKNIVEKIEETDSGSCKSVSDAFELQLPSPKSDVVLKLINKAEREVYFLQKFKDKPGFIPTTIQADFMDGYIKLYQPKLQKIDKNFAFDNPSSLEQLQTLQNQLGILLDATVGIGCMHNDGVVHRDIKPENILYETTEEGNIIGYITDLGLAFDLVNDDSSEEEGNGTDGSTAPEQRNGLTQIASDIWSLGMTLYKLVYGSEKEYVPLQKTIDAYSLYKLFGKDRNSTFENDICEVEMRLYPNNVLGCSKDLRKKYNEFRNVYKENLGNIDTKDLPFLREINCLIFECTEIDPQNRITLDHFQQRLNLIIQKLQTYYLQECEKRNL